MRSDAAPTVRERYFEDYVPGSVEEFGSASIGAAEIIEFATRYDPQPFHVDPDWAAAHGPFGGLIASGWHTGSIMMRLLVDNYFSAASSLGSPGIDELRWVRPVRPGDTLRVRVSIAEAKRSRSKPDRGLIRSRIEVLNQEADVVMSMTAINFMRCRDVATN
jgi:acyl dehydratase